MSTTVDSGDPRIVYSGGWSTIDCPQHFGDVTVGGGSHCANATAKNTSSIAIFTFNGTLVEVYGRAGARSSSDPVFFGIDDNPLRPVQQPPTTSPSHVYQSQPLLNGQHTLFIQVNGLFALHSIVFDASDIESSDTISSSTVTSSSPSCVVGAEQEGGDKDAAAIVGGVLGAAIMVLCAIIGVLLFLRRQEHRAAKRPSSYTAFPFARHPQLGKTLSGNTDKPRRLSRSSTPSSVSDLSHFLPASDPSQFLPASGPSRTCPASNPSQALPAHTAAQCPNAGPCPTAASCPTADARRPRHGSHARPPRERSHQPGHVRQTSSENRLPRKPPPPVTQDALGHGQGVRARDAPRMRTIDAWIDGLRGSSARAVVDTAPPFADTAPPTASAYGSDSDLPKYALPSPTQGGYGWTAEKAPGEKV
ncbi:hypothetical protein HDZ31DRAFT_48147 [Schizophyllum fasciatum]